MGDPCAGQTRAREPAAVSSNAIRLIFEANFGAALPTGSKRLVAANEV